MIGSRCNGIVVPSNYNTRELGVTQGPCQIAYRSAKKCGNLASAPGKILLSENLVGDARAYLIISN